MESVVEPFTPWLLLDREPGWARLQGEFTAERLHGEARYCWLVFFRTWSAFQRARDLLEAEGQSWMGFRSPVEQYLALAGERSSRAWSTTIWCGSSSTLRRPDWMPPRLMRRCCW